MKVVMHALRLNGSMLHIDGDAVPPSPHAGEAIVRIRRFMVCAADIESAAMCGFAGIVGSACIGVVESVQPDADHGGRMPRRDFTGRRVIAGGHVSCVQCELCRSGLGSHCRRRVVPGVQGRDGFGSVFARVPLSLLTQIPDAVTDDMATFALPLAHGQRAASVAQGEGKAYLTVIGDGHRAILATAAAARQNSTARLLYADPKTAAICERMGLRHRPLAEAGRRADQGAVIVSASNPDLRLAMQFVRPRGAVVVVAEGHAPAAAIGSALTGTPIPFDFVPFIQGEHRLVACRDGSIAEAMSLLERGEIDVSHMPVVRCRMQDANAYFQGARLAERSMVWVDGG